MTNSEKALEFIKDGDVVGLGSGKASTGFIRALGAAVAAGLRVQGIPTSEASGKLAQDLKIPLTTLAATNACIDITVDGADEVDRNLDLIKGFGGALVREKIVAAASRQLIILIGPDNVNIKRTDILGKRGILPVEIVPFGLPLCTRRLMELGYTPVPRASSAGLFQTDNGNYILDCKIESIPDPAAAERDILAIPGVVGTGLFVGMANVILVQDDDVLEILRRHA